MNKYSIIPFNYKSASIPYNNSGKLHIVLSFTDPTKTDFNNINKVLCALPLCAIINEKIFCVHGGLSPSINTID